MMKKRLLSHSGFTLIEVLVASAVGVGVYLILANAFLGVSGFQNRQLASSELQVNASWVSSQMMRIGKLAHGCSKILYPHSFTLGCSVEFTPYRAEWVEFSLTGGTITYSSSVPRSYPVCVGIGCRLVYTREGISRWSFPANAFAVCTGKELKDGVCDDSQLSLPTGSTFSTASLANYFRFRVHLRGYKGLSFATRGGFFARNSSTDLIYANTAGEAP